MLDILEPEDKIVNKLSEYFDKIEYLIDLPSRLT